MSTLQSTEITEQIIGCSFEVINELGSGFLENVYRNALAIALRERGLLVEVEKRYAVIFRGEEVGLYIPDLIVENQIVIELKCCAQLCGENQAQLINYLKVTGLPLGLLLNFARKKLEIKRVFRQDD